MKNSHQQESPANQIKTFAREKLGVDLIGICSAEPALQARKDLEEFLKLGYQGEMHYLKKTELRTDPGLLLPDARSVIVIAINYYREQPTLPPDHGRVARYAWGRDYHKVLRGVLKALQKFLDQNWPHYQHKICVDSAPLMEKVFAEQAGLGFYGKNTTLINPEAGSFILLGEIITTLQLETDAPRAGTCGTCTRCLEACPTGALIAPGRMDARRCISYLTIESKSPIPSELSEATGQMIAGCDICQEVCPYNQTFARPLTFEPLKQVRIAGDSIPLEEILSIKDSKQYLERFAGSPLMRPKRQGLIKNALNASLNAIRQNPQLVDKFRPLIKIIAESDSDQELRQTAVAVLRQLDALIS